MGNFCEAIGAKDWTRQEKFATKALRLRNQQDLDELITRKTIQWTPHEITEILQRVKVAATPVMNIEEQYTDPIFVSEKPMWKFSIL